MSDGRSFDAGTLPETVWRPPYLGTILALLAVFVVGAVLASGLGVTRTAGVTAAGAVVGASVIWLADRSRFRTVALALAVLLLFPAGALTIVGTSLVFLSQLAGTAPVGAVFLVGALGVAAFGAAALPSDAVDYGSTASAAKLAFTAGFLTVAAAALPIGGAVLANRTDLGIDLPTASPLAAVLAPDPGPIPPLGSLLVLLGLSAVALAKTLRALPLRELLDDGTEGENLALEALDQTVSILALGWWVLGVGILLAGANAAVPTLVWGSVPNELVVAVGEIAAMRVPRALAVGILLVAAIQLTLTRFVQGAYRTTIGAYANRIGMLAGWVGLLWIGWARAPFLTETLQTTITGSLPPTAADAFVTQWEAVLAYYGVSAVGLGMVAVCVAVAAAVIVGLALGMALGLVPSAGVGNALASGGVFVAGAFGIAVGAGQAASLAGIVAGVLVWELGTYGVELGREVGRRAPSRGAQLVHAGGTLLVSATAAAGALLAVRLVDRVPLASDAPAALALVGGLLAAIVFVMVLRR